MSEIFEIGVSLALNDGVSQGIERARRDMAQLERALAGGGFSMEGLRLAGRQAASPAQAAGSPEAPRRKPELPTAREPLLGATPAPAPLAKAAEEMVSPSLSPVPMEERVANTALPAAAPAPAAEFCALRPAQASAELMTATPALAPGRGLSEGSVAAALTASQAVVTHAAAGAPEPTGRGPAPTLLPWPAHMQMPQPLWEQMAGRGISASMPYDLGAEDNSAGAEPPADRWMTPHDHLTAMTAPTAASGDMTNTSSTRMAGDARAAMPATGRMVGGGAPGPAQVGVATSAAPAGQSAPSNPPGGDVFLDGVLVGRWMTRFLTKEVGRASAGPTKFDSRRGIMLPGVTVGN